MKYLPFEKITYESKLSKEEVLTKLAEKIQVENSYGYDRDSREKPYQGYIKENSFRIKRLINYSNAFLPILKGNVEAKGMKSIIKVKIRLNHFVLVFIIIWMVLASLGLLVFSIKSMRDETYEVLIPMTLLLFGYLLTTIGFKYESKKYKIFLKEMLE